MLDLIGRDGSQPVGTRLDHILGFRNDNDNFIKKVRRAQHTGLTRLEVSFFKGALDNYNPW